METIVVVHEVEDVAHWLASPRREAYFAPLGISVRQFTDPGGSARVGLLIETPDLATLEASLQTPEAADAMRSDGVRAETLQMLLEA